ncbi:hypothetical protein Acsp01_22680 [Actinoplanes sp. NBRC 101535]|nr:hypothetical protein Acsp01_22680 [Actinoplanes sp. NBRC 101535]
MAPSSSAVHIPTRHEPGVSHVYAVRHRAIVKTDVVAEWVVQTVAPAEGPEALHWPLRVQSVKPSGATCVRGHPRRSTPVREQRAADPPERQGDDPLYAYPRRGYPMTARWSL